MINPTITLGPPTDSSLLHLTVNNPYALTVGVKCFVDGRHIKQQVAEANEREGWVLVYKNPSVTDHSTELIHGTVRIEFVLLRGETQEQIRQEALDYEKWGFGPTTPRSRRLEHS